MYFKTALWKGNNDMSAIWGAIDLLGKPIGKEKQMLLRQAFDKCVIDRYEETISDNVYMGCGIQYFVPEAVHESLPFSEEDIFFTADAVLDNREELLRMLNMPVDEVIDMADGAILYAMYKKYGKKCLNDLLGAYAFVWYDRKKNKIEMILDAVGNRCVYYCVKDNIFYFSSLIEPLAEILEAGELNDRWLTDFLAMDYLFMVNEEEETPVKGIYRLAPAQYLCYGMQGIKKEIYWHPFESYQEYHLPSDEEYKKEFRQLWDIAVKSDIRNKKSTSILLSGGLDSTAVAAVAAPYIKEEGAFLDSYTSIPMKGFVADNNGYDVENEKDDVEKTAEYYGNINTHYVDLNGKNPWELSEKAIRSMETPIKSIQNYLWIEESLHKAYENHSRIMLTGSYGNTSISFTDLNVYMNTLFKQKRYYKLKKELDAFSSNMGFPVRYAWKQIIHTKGEAFESSSYPYGLSYVNRNTALELNCEQRLCRIEKNSYENIRDFEVNRRSMVHTLSMRQIGEAFTKHSLATGVLLRDPTIDKRIIEFCIHLPMDQFCKEGIDRRLVKVYLKDIMPPHVMQFQKKGKQSADLQYRFSLKWDDIRREWIDEYTKYVNSKYVNTLYARRQLIEQPNIAKYSPFGLTRHMYTLLVLKYEAYFRKKYGAKPEQNICPKKEEPLISVIIPVYNGKDYLEACLQSVCKQSYHKLEIIVIDDGSTDGSSSLCDIWAKQDGRIHVIHKENAGVSAARNAALEYAHGELLAFVDSDDTIESDMYKRMLEVMQEQDADCVCCGVKYVREGDIADYADGRVKVFYDAEMLDTYITGYQRCILSAAMWNGLYKRTLFAGITFPLIKKYEDSFVKALIMARVKKGIFLNQSFYRYNIREVSLSHATMTRQDIEQYLSINERKNKTIESLLGQTAVNKMYFNYYYSLLDMYFKVSSQKDKKILVKGMKKIRKQARKAFIQAEEMRIKDKLAMLLSTYSVMAYKFTLH